MHIGWDQPAFAVGKFEDLLDQVRAGEEKLLVRHEEDRLDRIVKVAVHLGHLKLVFEVGDRPQATDERHGLGLFGQVHDQAIEGHDRDIRPIDQVFLDHLHTLLRREEWLLGRIARHGDDHLVEDVPRAVDHVEVSIGDRIKRPRVDADFHK